MGEMWKYSLNYISQYMYMCVRICGVVYSPYLKYYVGSLCNFLLIARISSAPLMYDYYNSWWDFLTARSVVYMLSMLSLFRWFKYTYTIIGAITLGLFFIIYIIILWDFEWLMNYLMRFTINNNPIYISLNYALFRIWTDDPPKGS